MRRRRAAKPHAGEAASGRAAGRRAAALTLLADCMWLLPPAWPLQRAEQAAQGLPGLQHTLLSPPCMPLGPASQAQHAAAAFRPVQRPTWSDVREDGSSPRSCSCLAL